MHIGENKMKENNIFFFYHFMLLPFTVQESPAPRSIQNLPLVQPSSTTICANLCSNPFIVMEITLVFLLWTRTLQFTWGEGLGFYFWLCLQSSSATGIAMLQLR